MKKFLIFALTFALTLTIGYGAALAEPAAKATAQLGDLSILEISGSGGTGVMNSDDTGWTRIFTQDIKTPNGKDLFINVSLECGLTTDTTVMSRKLARAVAEAEAVVEVRVLVDGVPVAVNGNVDENGDPDPDTDITFARRNQKLIAEFAGDFSDCMTVDETGKVIVDWTCVDFETLQLILDTMSANSFNFIVPNLSADLHTVAIEAKLSYKADGNLITEEIEQEIYDMAKGLAAARAYLGNGSVTIETVRMIKGEDLVVDLQ
jgi:hypothetical protein